MRVKEGRIIVELSLSLPKRSWKIRTKVRRGRRGSWVEALGCYVFRPGVGDVIMEGDAFEWMITNEELRDLLLRGGAGIAKRDREKLRYELRVRCPVCGEELGEEAVISLEWKLVHKELDGEVALCEMAGNNVGGGSPICSGGDAIQWWGAVVRTRVEE